MKPWSWIGGSVVLLIVAGARCGLAGTGAEVPGHPSAAAARVASDTTAAPDSGYVFVEKYPRVVRRVKPSYPLGAQKLGIEGTVQLFVLVGRDGRVKQVRIKESVVGLNEAAIEAVYKWRFRPALSKGKPIAVWVVAPVNFRLH